MVKRLREVSWLRLEQLIIYICMYMYKYIHIDTHHIIKSLSLSLSLYIYIYICIVHAYVISILLTCMYMCIYIYICIVILVRSGWTFPGCRSLESHHAELSVLSLSLSLYIYIYIYIYYLFIYTNSHWSASAPFRPAAEGGMMRLETLVELNFLDSSVSSLPSCRN